MKIKQGLILREIAGEYVVLSVGDSSLDFNRMLVLNESGAELFRMLQEGAAPAELVCTLLKKYDVEIEQAKTDVRVFLEKLWRSGCMEDA